MQTKGHGCRQGHWRGTKAKRSGEILVIFTVVIFLSVIKIYSNLEMSLV